LNLIQEILLTAPVLLFSMVAHEYAHGYAAMKQGDMTASELGRLTFNPAKHIDPFMTVILPIMLAVAHMPIFGGAKPVPVNPNNYRNYRMGDIIVSLAGIVTNFAIAILCIPLLIVVGLVGQQVSFLSEPLAILQLMLERGLFINLLLAVFNLLPIPPLDGSHVFKYLLPGKLGALYERVSSAGFLILFALLYWGQSVLNFWFTPVFLLSQRFQGFYIPFMLPNPFPQ
jgi:Zn-dependent protease